MSGVTKTAQSPDTAPVEALAVNTVTDPAAQTSANQALQNRPEASAFSVEPSGKLPGASTSKIGQPGIGSVLASSAAPGFLSRKPHALPPQTATVDTIDWDQVTEQVMATVRNSREWKNFNAHFQRTLAANMRLVLNIEIASPGGIQVTLTSAEAEAQMDTASRDQLKILVREEIKKALGDQTITTPKSIQIPFVKS